MKLNRNIEGHHNQLGGLLFHGTFGSIMECVCVLGVVSFQVYKSTQHSALPWRTAVSEGR
jgi:hypothetical protein